MNINIIIVIILLIVLIIASDKFEFLKKRTEKYQKTKDLYLKIVGIFLFVILAYIIMANWNEIDWFKGSGGNPYLDY